MPEAVCVLVAAWVKSSGWTWVFAKAEPLLFITVLDTLSHEFRRGWPEKTCMQMNWLSSLDRWSKCKRSWSYGRLTWKERDFGPTWAKQRSWYLNRSSMCFRSLASEARLHRVSKGRCHKLRFLWWLFQLGPQEMQWYLWPFEAWSQLQV